jgi:hypothetical protein
MHLKINKMLGCGLDSVVQLLVTGFCDNGNEHLSLLLKRQGFIEQLSDC